MSKFSLFLTICLLFASLMAFQLATQHAAIDRHAEELAMQNSREDPRFAARRLNQKIAEGEATLVRQLSDLADHLPVPVAVSGVSSRPNVPASPRDLLAGKSGVHVGLDEARILLAGVDPKTMPLPSRITVYQEALLEWLKVRAKWPEPMGAREITDIGRVIGYPPELLRNLDPNLEEHRKVILHGMSDQKVQASDALDWLASAAMKSSFGRDESPSYFALLNATRGAAKPDLALLQKWALHSRQPYDDRLNALVGAWGSPDAWELLADRVRRSIGKDDFRRVHAHAMWYQARTGVTPEPLFEALWQKRAFRAELFWGRDSKVDRSDSTQWDQELSTAVTQWMREAALADADGQRRLYRKLLSIKPTESLRSEMLAFCGSVFPADPTAKSLADALWCRCAGEPELAMLVRQAQTLNRFRGDPSDPDATAIAIERILGYSPATATEVARFWMSQARWPRTVIQAWESGGTRTELAFDEVLLSTDLSQPSSGFQAALNVLSVVGGEPSLKLLELLESRTSANDRYAATFRRFIRSCRIKIQRRIER